MNVALWIVAGILALAFFAGGAGKMIMSKEKMRAATEAAAWTDDYSRAGIKMIGLMEVLGAVGLILPAVLNIAPILVPLAATGLVLIMIGASITRIRRGEYKIMLGDLAYLVAAGFVAYGRFFVEPFTG